MKTLETITRDELVETLVYLYDAHPDQYNGETFADVCQQLTDEELDEVEAAITKL